MTAAQLRQQPITRLVLGVARQIQFQHLVAASRNAIRDREKIAQSFPLRKDARKTNPNRTGGGAGRAKP
jgi:hypothetical protein